MKKSIRRGNRPLLILVLIAILVVTVGGSVLVTIWDNPKTITKHITITKSNPPSMFNVAVYKTDLYEIRTLASSLTYLDFGSSKFIDSCALVHLEGDIPPNLAIRAEINVLKDGNSTLIPWSFAATSVCYWRNAGGLQITRIETYTQDEDELIPDKDHRVGIPTIPSYETPLRNIVWDPNAIILEFNFSSIIDPGVYSIDIELSILGSE